MNRIKELIEKSGISQKIIAYEVGVSQPTISDWKTGRKTPSGKRLIKLSEVLGVSADYLLGRDEAPPPIQTEKASPKNKLTKKQKDLLDLYRDTAPEIRAAIDKLLETYAWTMKKAEEINEGCEKEN